MTGGTPPVGLEIVLPDTAPVEIAQALWKLIDGKNCIAWIGSGLSRVAEYPDWPTLIDRLCASCGVPPLDPTERSTVGRLLDKATECKGTHPDAYRATLVGTFGHMPVRHRRAYELLMKLPFRA